MQNVTKNLTRWSPTRQRFGSVLVLAVMVFLTGCSAGKNVMPETVEENPPVEEAIVVEAGPSVTRLEDGREGFVIREKPIMDEVWIDDFERAVDKMRVQDYLKAIELLEKVIAQTPGVTPPYINIAVSFERIGNHEQAERHLKTALELIPEHPVASNEYGLLLRKTGRFAEARTIYEKALETFPEYLPVRKNLGILCDLYLDDPACALEQYEIYSAAKPEDEQVKMWIADLRFRMERGG
jgi:Flp pilus assembly protein TadD